MSPANGFHTKIMIGATVAAFGLFGSFMLGATYKQGLMDAHIRDGHPDFVIKRVVQNETKLTLQQQRMNNIDEDLDQIIRRLDHIEDLLERHDERDE